MTLHEKIIELLSLGFHIRFEHGNNFSVPRTIIYINLRYDGNAGVKIENRKAIAPEAFKNEVYVVITIDDMYKEMKHHAYGEKHYFLPEKD